MKASANKLNPSNISVGLVLNQSNSLIQPKIFPNPCSGEFTIEMSSILKPVQICIYNSFGNSVFSSLNYQSNNYKIDLSAQPKGIYFIELRSRKTREVRKIILN